MIDFLATEAMPFSIAFGFMLLIGLMEMLSVLFGMSMSSLLDSVLPDVDFDVDMDGAHPGHDGALAHLFSFLAVGKVPVLMLLILFLAFFSLSGHTVQFVAAQAFGSMLPAWLASIPAAAAGLFGMGRLGNLLARFMPKDVSDVGSRNELIGATATIIRGEARFGHPAEAKARDLRGKLHYILVEPREGEPALKAGDTAMVLRQTDAKSIFVATNDFGPSKDQTASLRSP